MTMMLKKYLMHQNIGLNNLYNINVIQPDLMFKSGCITLVYLF